MHDFTGRASQPPTLRTWAQRFSRRFARGCACAAMLACLAAPTRAADAPASALAGLSRLRTSDLVPSSMYPPTGFRPKEFTFIHANGLFHLFWMRSSLRIDPDSTENDLGHAISADLVHWTQLDSVLLARPGKWDDWKIWSPTLYESGGTYYMYYTGVTSVPYGWPYLQRIGVATSTDLMNWTRYDDPVFTTNLVPWAFNDSTQFDGCQFRDPFVMADPTQAGRWLIYYVTVPRDARGQLIIGVGQNTQGLGPWSDLMPLWATDLAHFWGWDESPHLFQHNGLWYLFSTTDSGHPVRFRTAPSPIADSTLWSGTYRLFDMANGDSMTDLWFGSEELSYAGHDYLAFANSGSNAVDIVEIVWGTPPYFTLKTPAVAGVEGGASAPRLALTASGRAGGGSTLILDASLPWAMDARIELFDVAGRRVRELRAGPFPAGQTLVPWDGRSDAGEAVARGMYFASLRTPAGRRSVRVPVVY